MTLADVERAVAEACRCADAAVAATALARAALDRQAPADEYDALLTAAEAARDVAIEALRLAHERRADRLRWKLGLPVCQRGTA